MMWETGDEVIIRGEGRKVEGTILLASPASPNGQSLMLEFEAILFGHVGRMPVLEKGGIYTTLLGGHEIKLSKAEDERA